MSSEKKAATNVVAKWLQVALLVCALAGAALEYVGKSGLAMPSWVLLALGLLVWLGRGLAGTATANNATLYAVMVGMIGMLNIGTSPASSPPEKPDNSITEVLDATITDSVASNTALPAPDSAILMNGEPQGVVPITPPPKEPPTTPISDPAIVPIETPRPPLPRRRAGRLRRSIFGGMVGIGLLLSSGCGTVGSQYILRDDVRDPICRELEFIREHQMTLAGQRLNDAQLKVKVDLLLAILDGRDCLSVVP